VTSKPHSVLVVEDERIVAMDIQQELIQLGYDAYAVASSGEEAITRSAERCPDIVLMDIRIEGHLDGIETAAILRERFGVPVIFLTAHADKASIERAKKTEPFGYLLKPVHPVELSRVLEISLFRAEMERRLRERERWFSTTLRSIADAVMTVDLAGNVNFMNPAAEVLTGFKADDVIGRPAGEVLLLVDENSQSATETPLNTALREGGPVNVELSGLLNSTSGTVRLINDSAARVMDRGRALGAVMVFRDVTEQKNFEKRLELSDRLTSLGTMAASVAHEIKNPLAVVVANLEFVTDMLKRNHSQLDAAHMRLPPQIEERLKEVGEALSDIGSAGDRIGKIVSDLSTFSLPGQAQYGRVDVRRSIEWAIRATTHEMRYRASVRTSFSDVPMVEADEAKLGQVLVNLLLNAAHAIEPGNMSQNEVSITVSSDAEGRVVIAVKDSGAGMSPEVLAHIFEPFFTTKDIGVGTGLGLSICHGIVTSLGGELQAESQIGHGSTFRVILSASVDERAAPVESVPRFSQRQHARILVVDDESSVQRTMRRVLETHEVVAAASGRQALEILRQGESFDLIFSDMMMPDMTGMEFYEVLLQTFPDLARRVVFVSGGGITPQTKDFLAAVTNPRVEKPFSAGQLRGTVDELLARLPPRDATIWTEVTTKSVPRPTEPPEGSR
jgi:two-component system cell cycle sensor histidine kinase/response regulator CckA